MKKKPSINLIVSIILMITVIGFSAAYYIAQLSKSGDNANAIMLTKTLGLRFTDGPEFNLNGALPGQKTIKTFSVQNTGNVTSSYNLAFVDVVNELTRKSDLVYTISSTNNGYSNNTEASVPTSNYTFASNVTIPANTTQIYTLTVEYKNLNVDQTTDMNKNVSFKINITDTDTNYGARLASGLYNANDELIYSWDELIEQNLISVQPISSLHTEYHDFSFNEGDMVLSAGSNHCDWNDTDCNLLAGKIVVDDSIVYIGDNAFEYSAITSAYIPANVKVISNGFENTKKLTNITFEPNSQLMIIDGFEWTGLTSIEIPASVVYIGTCAFTDARNLTSVTFESNSLLQVIDDRAFDSTALTSIDIPAGVTTIGGEAFLSTNLTSVHIPANVESIGYYAFNHIDELTSVTFAANSQLTTIGDNAFDNSRRSIGVMTVPSSVTSIDSNAFGGVVALYYNGSATDSNEDHWGALYYNPIINNDFIYDTTINTKVVAYTGSSTTINIPAGVTVIGESIFEDSLITSVNIPSSVVSIGDRAFANTEKLTSVTFASNSQLTTIGDNAFDSYRDSYIADIYLPSSVTSIGDYAFNGVDNLHYSGSAVHDEWDYWGANNLITD